MESETASKHFFRISSRPEIEKNAFVMMMRPMSRSPLKLHGITQQFSVLETHLK